MALAIDALTIAHKLEAAGLERRQAEACAEAFRDAVVIGYSEFATRADLERALTPFATKEDLQKFVTNEHLERVLARFATKEDLANLERRMVWRWAASTVSLAGLIVAMPFIAG